MSLLQAIVMGVLQGATEFIPVSSSGHLVLIPWLLRWPIPPVTFDAIVHWGTLLALVVYFWAELKELAAAWFKSIALRRGGSKAYIAWLIILGTIPGVVGGLAFEDFFEELFSHPRAVSVALLVTAVLLTTAEVAQRPRKKMGRLAWYEVLLIGVFQAFAIIPGISRSGSTIAAGIFTGLGRDEAARFSFLLSFPIIFGAGLKKALDIVLAGELTEQWNVLLLGFLAAALSGYIGIAFLLAYLRRRKLYVFAVYCLALGILGLALTS